MTISAPPPDQTVLEPVGFFKQPWMRWVLDVSAALGGRQPLALWPRTVAQLPDAAKWRGHILLVTDETDGEVPAWSDGTNWRRTTDRAVVS